MAAGELVRSALQAMSWAQLVVATAGSLAAYQVLDQAYGYWKRSRSPLRDLPGPRTDGNFLFGHLRMMFRGDDNEVQRGWADEYGATFSIRGMLGKYQLVTTDDRAITHILFASHIFQKPESQRRGIVRFLGEGILFAEGAQHRDQRRIINPAFGFSQVRDMTEIFLEKAAQLRDIWSQKCIASGGTTRLDALDWLGKATLDAIGKAGFDYEFGTLNENGTKNELAAAFEGVMRRDTTPLQQIRVLLNTQFPLHRVIFSKKKMDEIGMRIVQEKKREILDEMGAGRIEKNTVGGKDLISLLLRANLAADLPPSQRLSDSEVLAQIPTFIVAGHATTSNATAWAMYSLAVHPETQMKLRAELHQVGTDAPALDVLNALPYLDYVTRETLRLHSVVLLVPREAQDDDVVPLETPIKDRNGNTISSIKVRKGDEIQVPIALINRSKAIWGADADEFRPERWERPPAEASALPGITPNLMTFLGGPRSCVGHRFAVAEMKAFLFHIVRGFEFELAVPRSELWTRTGAILRPQLREDNSIQLPLYITPVQ
ncbi:cytochrome P450 [Auricularia subglabra TFB-10046 SS5]|uniref:Cytochrome P450 n=1 Tax=Auricularia subglabra (strain TFB-10046 / SS5) TaxID=717982 RepID=J0DB65_AURST|nr:cytochrome P450 [Auricularia subglabra TFB-10046 SS5]